MQTKRCLSCGKSFHPQPQTPTQAYCSNPECQRARRRKSQQNRRKSENLYQEHNQANRDWAAKNPGYSKQYRSEHPEYVIRNRAQQKQRNQKHRQDEISSEAVSTQFCAIPSGRYKLTPITPDGIAKETYWVVNITFISES